MAPNKKIYRLLRLFSFAYWHNRRALKKIRKKEKEWNDGGCRPYEIRSE
tara:strand:+ start:158 stop:304 length:147 start_codon:yes stop_codon:yes gene_type:complete